MKTKTPKLSPANLIASIEKEEGTLGVAIWRFLQGQEATKKYGVNGRVVHRFEDLLVIFASDNTKPEKAADSLADKLVRMFAKGWLRIAPNGEISAI